LHEINNCIHQRFEIEARDDRLPPPQSTPVAREEKISGNIGKIEIPGFTAPYDFTDGDKDNDSSEDSEPETKSNNRAPKPSGVNFQAYASVPLPPTPNATPVQSSMIDDFDSIANRTAVPAPVEQAPPPPYDSFADAEPVYFPNTQPLQPVPVPSSSILQPIPVNTTPYMHQQPPVQTGQPHLSGYDGFAALKNLDVQQQGGNFYGGNYNYPQMQPAQMFTQMQVPQANIYTPNLSIEEQMNRLSMHAPNFPGNY